MQWNEPGNKQKTCNGANQEIRRKNNKVKNPSVQWNEPGKQTGMQWSEPGKQEQQQKTVE